MPRRPQVAVIGASAAPVGALTAAEALGTALVDAGYRIVCGGRDGVMAAVCRGAHHSAAHWDGATVGILPSTNPADANAWVDVILPTGLGLARNAVVVHAADAVVVVDGGAGTLSEIALAWQLGKPLCALDTGTGWAHRLAGEAVDPRPRAPVHRATDPAEVVDWLGEVVRLLPRAPRDEDV
jgi:uncharacterized protein (TIGR00725 family)